MKCENVNRQILGLLEGTIENEQAKLLSDHISSCSECASMKFFMEQALNIIEEDKSVVHSASFTESVVAKVSSRRHGRSIAMHFVKPLAAAAAIIFGLVTSFYLTDIASRARPGEYADLPDEFYYANEIHLETIESFFLINDSYENE